MKLTIRARAWAVLAAQVGLAALSGALAPRARASEFHYQNILPGERAMGMAGAFTALGADTSSAWYNPAGLGFLTMWPQGQH